MSASCEAKRRLGSGAIMVFDETVDPLLVAWRLAKFFAHESCGKCTPCREGSGWLEKVLYRMAHGYGRAEDLDLILSFGNNVAPGLSWPPGMTTICQLGPSIMSAPEPISSAGWAMNTSVPDHWSRKEASALAVPTQQVM